MNSGTTGLGEPQDGADDFGGASLTRAKEFAQRLDPTPAEAYADHLALVIERTSEVAATYLRVSGELESWQSDAGALCADRLGAIYQHAKGIRDIATDIRAAMLEAAGAATQTRNRTTDLADWQVPYTSTIARGNDENTQSAQHFRDDLDGGLLRTSAVLGSALAPVLGRLSGAPTRGELLRDPYTGADQAGAARQSPTTAPGAVPDAEMETDPLARTLPLSPPANPRSPSTPARRVPAQQEPAATTERLGVFGEFGFDDPASGAAGAAPQQPATAWMSAPDAGPAPDQRWRAPLIGDGNTQRQGVTRLGDGPIISAYDYEPPPSDRDTR